MSFAEFEASAGSSGPAPADLSAALLALWHDRRGDWPAAHAAAQSAEGSDAAWVHAYLHRKEGDTGNAGYWYRRAGKPPCSGPVGFDAEWAEIARALTSV